MMKTTTANSMRVKARRDAWDIGRAGRVDSSSIGFDTSGHIDDLPLGKDRPTSPSARLTASEDTPVPSPPSRWSPYRNPSRSVGGWRGTNALPPKICSKPFPMSRRLAGIAF